MVSELNLGDSGGSLLTSVVAKLIAKAPARAKCIFLNCEMRDTSDDIAISPDLFAVVKPLFGKAKRVVLEVDWETADLLMSLGRHILSGPIGRHVTIDLIINERGSCKAYRDDGSLRRLAGGDGMYRSKYLYYLEQAPWLAALNKLG